MLILFLDDRETHSGSPSAPVQHSSSVLVPPLVVRADDSPPVEWVVRSTSRILRHHFGEKKGDLMERERVGE
jgi:hypothetical protein